jgi:mRNA-degrading endonuclease YafQ of YafQ-DinJ toxin-antitoxin module
LKRHPSSAPEIQIVLDILSADAAAPSLRTHKLHGKLSGRLACRVGRDLRIVFEFAQQGGNEAIVLLALGTHDDVY